MPEIRGNFGSFKEAEDYFRQKVNLPTRKWNDLWQGQHARAFVAAGVTRDAVLTDLRRAVDDAISKGETLDDFRKKFADIVKAHGWIGGAGGDSAAGMAWRTSVIYHTNIRTAYQAGRWETLKHFPYLKYKHNTIRNPREHHKAWDGLVLPTSDAWWKTHYPPNGWGCRCTAYGISEARLKADGKRPDAAPPDVEGDPPPEWRYHVGQASTGQQLSEQDMQYWRDQKGDAWEVLTQKQAADYGRPEQIPLDVLPRPLAAVRRADGDELRALLRGALGADERVFKLKVSDDFSYDMVATVEELAKHIDPARASVVPLLPDVMEQPFEVWQMFMRHKGSGRMVLRTRYIRAFDMPERPGMMVVMEAVKGRMVSWTLMPSRIGYLERQRQGNLLYGR